MSVIYMLSGKTFNFIEPNMDDFDVIDVARALSNICRFGGHVKYHYSVAQHSWLCSYLAPSEFAFEALCHDMTEAYLGDVITQLKRRLPEYKLIESNLEEKIRAKLLLPPTMSEQAHRVDLEALLLEKKVLLNCDEEWEILDGIKFRGEFIDDGYLLKFTPEIAYKNFLRRFAELCPVIQ